jgi:hypothetical protein
VPTTVRGYAAAHWVTAEPYRQMLICSFRLCRQAAKLKTLLLQTFDWPAAYLVARLIHFK